MYSRLRRFIRKVIKPTEYAIFLQMEAERRSTADFKSFAKSEQRHALHFLRRLKNHHDEKQYLYTL